MFDILTIVLPVFLIIAAGYLSVKSGIFENGSADILMKFVMGIAIPCLLFNAVAQLDLTKRFDPALLASFYIGAALAFTCAGLMGRYVFGRTPGEAVAIGFSALFANLVLMGMPISELAYGAEALEFAVAIVSLHAPFCYFSGILAMELARADGRRLSETLRVALRAIFSNALTLGIALGFLVNFTKVPVPEPVFTATGLLGRAGPPVALFALGAVLTRYRISDRLTEIGYLSLSRLVLTPALAYLLAFHIFGLPDIAAKTVTLLSAMPAGLNTYVFADMYNRAKGTAASNVLVGTALGVVSISVWLAILG